jgi:hypothetical protein
VRYAEAACVLREECAGKTPGGVALYHTGGNRYRNINAERHDLDVLLLTVGWGHFITENAFSRWFRLRLRYRGGGNFCVSVLDHDDRCVTVARSLLFRCGPAHGDFWGSSDGQFILLMEDLLPVRGKRVYSFW